MNKVKLFAFKSPIIISASLFFLASFLCILTKNPSITLLEQYMNPRKATFLYFIVYQGLWAVAVTFLIRGVGIQKTAGFTKPGEWKKLWLCWPLAALMIPLVWDILSGNTVFNAEPIDYILYFVLNLSVGFYEELMGRSFALNLMLQKWGKTKKGLYYAIFVSSILFGVIHLTTVILGKRELIPGIGQMFYTTFFGIFFGACYIRYHSVWPPMFLHTLFDLFGSANSLTSGFGAVQKASVSDTMLNVVYFIPLLICGIFLLRKVKLPDNS